MKKFFLLGNTLFLSFFLLTNCNTQPVKDQAPLTFVTNPILPGYFADPSIVENDGTYYLYVTSDPWGTDFLACWESDDFVNWKFHALNWPTKEACTTPQSGGSMVWAPSVIKRGNEYFMYISVGSEVWCGKASHPLGPWENMLGDEPMIPYDTSRYYHVIDAEAFADDDGRYYLYWGSGWDWKDGRCFVAELDDDMCSFRTEPVDVTPANYFEAPLMIKKDGVYYLMYSDGITMNDTYKVRYAIGDNPIGPFTEAGNSPILYAEPEKEVYGPGHHTVTEIGGELYILYHKHRLPFVEGTAYRQTCIDRLLVNTEKKLIEKVEPTDWLYVNLPAKDTPQLIMPEAINASSQIESRYEALLFALDTENNQSIWRSQPEDSNPLIEITLPEEQAVSYLSIRFEYPWQTYSFDCDVSTDGKEWTSVYQNNGEQMVGSPLDITITSETDVTPRYVRLSFKSSDIGIWSIGLY